MENTGTREVIRLLVALNASLKKGVSNCHVVTVLFMFTGVRPSALKASEKIHQQLAAAYRKPMKALQSVGGSLALPKTPEVVR